MSKQKEEIMKHMKTIEKMNADDPSPEIFNEGIEGKLADGVSVPTDPEFRMKKTTLQHSGALHIQMGHPNPSEVWEDLKESFDTPYVETNSERVLRQYGVAFNIVSASGSIDQHEMKELGHRLHNASNVRSFASAADDYVKLEYVGLVDGKDNNGDDVKMLEFLVGGEETLHVAYSHLDVLTKTPQNNYPTIRQECLLAWLVANYIEEVN